MGVIEEWQRTLKLLFGAVGVFRLWAPFEDELNRTAEMGIDSGEIGAIVETP